MKTVRVDSTHPDFITLTEKLDAEVNERYGSKQSNYDKHNQIDPLNTAIIGYEGSLPVACGCFKAVGPQILEIKRMYVAEAFRRRGFSVLVLHALEKLGLELGFYKAILETGKGQPEAIRLYHKCGYKIIENYGPYQGLEDSVCMEKFL